MAAEPTVTPSPVDPSDEELTSSATVVGWHYIKSDIYYNADPKDIKLDDLYFLWDTGELYRGLVAYTDSVFVYSGTRPTDVAMNHLYYNKDTGIGEVYNGAEWTTIIKPVGGSIASGIGGGSSTDPDPSDNLPVTGQAVKDFFEDKTLKVEEILDLTEFESGKDNDKTVPSTITVIQYVNKYYNEMISGDLNNPDEKKTATTQEIVDFINNKIKELPTTSDTVTGDGDAPVSGAAVTNYITNYMKNLTSLPLGDALIRYDATLKAVVVDVPST